MYCNRGQDDKEDSVKDGVFTASQEEPVAH